MGAGAGVCASSRTSFCISCGYICVCAVRCRACGRVAVHLRRAFSRCGRRALRVDPRLKIEAWAPGHQRRGGLFCRRRDQGSSRSVALPRLRALVVERQEADEDFLLRQVRGPAVGGEDGCVEGAVSVCEPLGAGVVEVGEGAPLSRGQTLLPPTPERRVTPSSQELYKSQVTKNLKLLSKFASTWRLPGNAVSTKARLAQT
jgi:hypothetical protein